MPVWIAVSESEWKANPDKVKKTTYLTETVYIEERYKGQVLHEFERNYHDDSDFYAKIWDPVAGQSFDYMWGTTRGWTYANGCQPDALPEYGPPTRPSRPRKRKPARRDDPGGQGDQGGPRPQAPRQDGPGLLEGPEEKLRRLSPLQVLRPDPDRVPTRD